MGEAALSGFWGSGAGHSSKDMDWETPLEFWQRLDAEFAFELDAAASHDNAKCSVYLTEEDDALSQSWVAPQSYTAKTHGVLGGEAYSIWVNPPYGRSMGDWMQKAYEESREGATVVCLVYACTDTKWWADWVWRAAEVRFVVGRLNFKKWDGSTGPAPKGSAVVVFAPWSEGPPQCRLMER